jgi:uncharacterized protein (TIGR02118 family)
MCFVKRNPALSVEEFHQHWRTRHADLIRNNPAAQRYVKRYEQNHRLASDYGHGEPEYDGAVSQWFESADDFWAMVTDPTYQAEVGPDERSLLDFDKTVWILTEVEEVMIGD